jgi:hypothetical protein
MRLVGPGVLPGMTRRGSKFRRRVVRRPADLYLRHAGEVGGKYVAAEAVCDELAVAR